MTSRQDLENASALIATAVGLIRQAEPVMRRAENVGGASTAVHGPIFRAAAELVRMHDVQMGMVRAALEKANHG